jgi:glycosyltransferase involved in cell wall biosynthesis
MPFYELNSINCTVSPLFNDEYLKGVYEKRALSVINVLKCYFNRFIALFSIQKFDIIIIEKELFPYLPAFAEWFFKFLKIKVIVDYDDAIFHNYNLSGNKLVKLFLGDKIKRVMKYADVVVAGNSYIFSYAERAGAKRILIIPTVINIHNYDLKESTNANEVIIGWIGSPITLKYLKSLSSVLLYLCSRYPIKIHIIGGKSGIGLPEYETILEWQEEREVKLIRECDIGIMPLLNSPWENGKCGYKLIQYMGCGLPVIGSPVGVNEFIIKNGVNGFKAIDLDQWQHYLELLILDKNLRIKMGAAGRLFVTENFSLESKSKDWIALLRSI